MLTLINPSPICIDLLGLFFTNSSSRFYLREIQRLLKKPVGSLQRHLNRLEEEKLLLTEKQGPLKYFYLNTNHPYYPELQSIFLREIRRKKLDQALKKLMRHIKKDYKPDKVILYGSLATGRVSLGGDIDLLIIKKNVPKRYWDRIKEIAPLIAQLDIGIDVVIWTPDELASELRTNHFLKTEILTKGKVIYERAA